jgi:hypothetical protein
MLQIRILRSYEVGVKTIHIDEYIEDMLPV